ncbi:MAG: phosphoribosylglycinamide formyltransferase [Vicinamibacteria bacterium]
MKRVAVLASGRGSNLAALVAAQSVFPSYRVVLVISNVEDSGALILAREAAIPALCFPSLGRPRDDHERSVVSALSDHAIDMVCLAGYMRVLGPKLIDGFLKPILNIHPSLLPAFPGMHAQRQAVEAGVRWSGATVHFVDAGLDSGPIILQDPVKVEPDDTEAALSSRILKTEHAIYPQATDIVARDAYEIRGRTVHLFGVAPQT